MTEKQTATGAPEEETGPIVRGRFGQRASKCADEAWASEVAREQAMTPQERMMLALELDEETDELLAWLGAKGR